MGTVEPRQGKTGPTRVLIVDDHPIVRQGLAQLLGRDPSLEVCGDAGSVREALELADRLKPDVAIVDLSLGGRGGMDLIRDMRARHPGLLVLVLSMYDEALYAERALRAGARGYISKEEGTDKVVAALHKVLGGEVYLSDAMSTRMLQAFVGGAPASNGSPLERLSDRELQVFELIGQGKGTRETAEALHLSVKTIETYRAHIKTKLGLRSSIELLQHATRWVEGQGTS